MDKYLIVDRIEESFAVCENDELIEEISLNFLPEDVKEGDVLVFDDEGNYIVDREQTESRRAMMNKILSDLWN